MERYKRRIQEARDVIDHSGSNLWGHIIFGLWIWQANMPDVSEQSQWEEKLKT